MADRIPASMRTREALSARIEGRLASPAGRSELVELATRLIVEEALEGEVRDALERGYYERGAAPGQGLGNGHRTHRLKTAAGGLEYSARGLGDPLLVVSDGAAGLVKAIEVCFPRSARQRCLAHRMRNLAAKVPDDLWPEFKARAAAAYQAPSRKIARELADGVVADYGSDLANAVDCIMDDFDACIAHLRLPIAHHRATRTTNLLERLFVEERRRLKIIPNAFGEKAVLKLMFGAMTRAAERWRALRITPSSAARWPPSGRSSIRMTKPPSASTRPAQSPPPPPKFPAASGLDPCLRAILIISSLPGAGPHRTTKLRPRATRQEIRAFFSSFPDFSGRGPRTSMRHRCVTCVASCARCAVRVTSCLKGLFRRTGDAAAGFHRKNAGLGGKNR